MVIAKGDQRSQLKLAFRSAKLVFHHDCVLAVDHENPFLNLDASYLEDEHRKGIAAELFQEQVAGRMHCAWIAIGGEVVSTAVENDGLLHLGQQYHSTGRRLGGGDQQAVVATGVEADDCR